jgi:hypothetical protein
MGVAPWVEKCGLAPAPLVTFMHASQLQLYSTVASSECDALASK